jgi:hypothetical protein
MACYFFLAASGVYMAGLARDGYLDGENLVDCIYDNRQTNAKYKILNKMKCLFYFAERTWNCVAIHRTLTRRLLC